MHKGFGQHVRQRRLLLQEQAGGYSVRGVARRIGVQPSFLSKVEREEAPPPSEEKISRLAEVLGEDRDVLLALAGKVSTDLREAILKRPQLFAELIRQVKDLPEAAVLRLVREVRVLPRGKRRVVLHVVFPADCREGRAACELPRVVARLDVHKRLLEANERNNVLVSCRPRRASRSA